MALLVTIAALFAAAASYATAAYAGGDNAAVAINTRDDSSKFKFKFSVRNEAGDVVDNQNVAIAYASCERCDSTAIAIQIVLVSSHPSTVTPANVAFSLNENCSFCTSYAGAWQIVRGTDGPVRFTGDGRRQIEGIEHEIRDLKKQALTPDALDARLGTYVDEVRGILDTELVPRGPGEPENDPAALTDSADLAAPGSNPAGEYTGGVQDFMGALAAATTPA
jgi:putative peptide zinc metalloprotease protein